MKRYGLQEEKLNLLQKSFKGSIPGSQCYKNKTLRQNKLECLPLTRFFRLVNYLLEQAEGCTRPEHYPALPPTIK